MLYLNLFTIFYLLICVNGKEYKAVDDLDVTKYVGKWYQVYKDSFNRLFQGNGKCAFAEYSILDDDDDISVYNQQLNNDNKIESIYGYAYYKDGDCCGYLTVMLENNPEAPYWVLELGPVVDNYYDYSIVSDNNALSLFVLTRNVDRFYELYNDDVLISLDEFGFNKLYNSPIEMNQTNCSAV